MSAEEKKTNSGPTQIERFVMATIKQCQEDKGLAARLRRADNPATEYQCWEHLAGFGIDLEKNWIRLPFATIAAAIARAKPDSNGTLKLGQAITMCYADGNGSDQARARLRRLLACDSTEEACRLLRPVLALIESRVSQPLDYERLLGQLRFFGERTRTQWAQELYGKVQETEGEVAP